MVTMGRAWSLAVGDGQSGIGRHPGQWSREGALAILISTELEFTFEFTETKCNLSFSCRIMEIMLRSLLLDIIDTMDNETFYYDEIIPLDNDTHHGML